MIVEQIITLFYQEMESRPDTAELLRPLAEGMTKHGDILEKLPGDVWGEMIYLMEQGDDDLAQKAFIESLSPGGKIAMIKESGLTYEESTAKYKEAWGVARSVGVAIAENAVSMLLNSLVNK